jgi:uncharacterized membrane protein YcaP (DUF421 family)
MLFYAIVFIALGAVVGLFIKNQENAMITIIGITIVWALAWGPWAIAAFIELMIGYAIVGGLKERDS